MTPLPRRAAKPGEEALQPSAGGRLRRAPQQLPEGVVSCHQLLTLVGSDPRRLSAASGRLSLTDLIKLGDERTAREPEER